MLNVHLLHTPQPDHLAYLQSCLVEAVQVTTGDSVPDEVHVLVTGRPGRDHLTDKPNLSAILIPFAGLPASTAELMQEFPQISIHNLHHNAPMTAEMALALLLAAAKRLIPIHEQFRHGDWRPRYAEHNPTVVLDGKTALILGYGAIGKRIGAVCRALGMRVLGIRRQARPDDPDYVHSIDQLQALLPRTDVLMICLPGTPETEGLIGAAELALMPPGGLLVNVGRGAVIDQEALYTALRDGHLHAGGMDVWYNYPREAEARANTPPADYPFGELDNVVMSPHRAGGGGAHEVEIRRMTALAESINALASGEPMPHQINLEAGY